MVTASLKNAIAREIYQEEEDNLSTALISVLYLIAPRALEIRENHCSCLHVIEIKQLKLTQLKLHLPISLSQTVTINVCLSKLFGGVSNENSSLKTGFKLRHLIEVLNFLRFESGRSCLRNKLKIHYYSF